MFLRLMAHTVSSVTKPVFTAAGARRPEALDALPTTIITRVTRTLVHAGVRVVEDEQPYLELAIASPYEQLAGAPIRYVIAAGPQAGRATMRLHDPVLAVGVRFHATESLPATSFIDANFEAISAELLGHVDRGRSGFRNAYDNAWMPVQPSIGRTITVTRRFSTQQLKAGRHLRRLSTGRLKCLPPSLMPLSVDSLRLKRALERVERLLDHDGSFMPRVPYKGRPATRWRPYPTRSAPATAQAVFDALCGLVGDQRQSFGDDLMLRCCTRFARERALPPEVFGPVLKPPCMRQRPLRGRFFHSSQTASALQA